MSPAKFPKSIRLRKRHQFLRLIRSCNQQVGNWLVVDSRENRAGYTRLGITITRRFGKSHDRNRLKRLIREAFRLSFSQLKPGYDLNVKPRTAAKAASLQELQRELLQFFGAVNENGLSNSY